MTIKLTGRIDSSNAAMIEMRINEQIAADTTELVLDAADLTYISSAGLRVILRLKKAIPDTKIENCSTDVYEIFDMTGFTEIIPISKAYRKISVEGCEVIGEGANGIVYRADPETIVKVYKLPDSLSDIHRERELARKAFVMGIPTAIPYDVVQVGDLFGSVYELLNAKPFSLLLAEGEDLEELARQSVDILKIIHATSMKEGELPSKKEEAMRWAESAAEYLPTDLGAKLVRLFAAIPDENTTIHGDYHVKNIMRQGKENLLIDMDTLSVGHPIFEFSQMYLAYCGYAEIDPTDPERFFNLKPEVVGKFWRKSVDCYFEGKDEAFKAAVIVKARIIAYAKIIRSFVKKQKQGTPNFEKIVSELTALLPCTDSLTY